MHLSRGLAGQRLTVKPGPRHGGGVNACQGQCLGEQTSLGIKVGQLGLTNQITGDQRTIVMTGAAQLQQHFQPGPMPPVIRQLPAATGIEQIPFMHEHAIHPETHLVRPPAEHQALKAVLAVLPVLRPADGLLDPQPDTTPRPDQQPTLRPVRTVLRTPGLFKDGLHP